MRGSTCIIRGAPETTRGRTKDYDIIIIICHSLWTNPRTKTQQSLRLRTVPHLLYTRANAPSRLHHRELYSSTRCTSTQSAAPYKLVAYSATREQWAEWLRVPLEHAAARGNLDLFNSLLKAGANGSEGWRGCRGRTLIDAAALGGNADIVSSVLRTAQPDVNVVSVASGRSALYTATVCGHEDTARRLVVAGADVNFQDPVEKSSVMCKAMMHGHHMLANDLVLAGLDVDLRTGLGGNTPLHVAALEGMDDLVSSLLLRGADKDALNVASKTPLMHASRRGHLAVVHTLMAAGADATLSVPFGRSALRLAAKYGHVDVLEAMVGHGVDVNARGDHDKTALHIAAHCDGAGAVDALIEVGADVNARMDDGTTPLMYAAWFTRSDSVCALFLERGASLKEEDNDGKMALHILCRVRREGVAAVVDLLLQWGADNALNGQNMDPAYLLQDQYYESEWHVCSRDELDRAILLLARAQEDRAWRRRRWVVMLRSRAKAARASRDGIISRGGRGSSVADHGLEEGLKVARRENEAACGGGVRSQDNGESGCGSFSGLMEVVLGLETETVFRTIVGFL